MSKIKEIILGIGVLSAVGVYNFISKKKVSKYSYERIKNLTDKEWEIERKIVQDKYRNPQYDNDKRIEFWNILKLYDKVKSDKDWNGKKPQGPAYHREHGFGLYKPD